MDARFAKLNVLYWRHTRRSALANARRSAVSIRQAVTDEDRWFYAVQLAQYRDMARNASRYAREYRVDAAADCWSCEVERSSCAGDCGIEHSCVRSVEAAQCSSASLPSRRRGATVPDRIPPSASAVAPRLRRWSAGEGTRGRP